MGWTIHGKLSGEMSHKINSPADVYLNNCYKDDCKLENLDQSVKQYFELETLGVSNFPLISTGNKHALSILAKTSRHINGSWEIGLLWKDEASILPQSKVLNRLRLLERRLNRDADYAKMYTIEMNRSIEKGFAIKASHPPKGRTWYLPHFGVKNVNKPDKVRLVFDAASQSNKVSFNDLLRTGPDLLKSLLSVIMRLHQKLIAVKGDVRDMFLMVKIREEYRDAQQFFWRGVIG